ncbi:hypothetical protein [Bradyrhizobium sp. AZCC 1693]|uniref:hypothetical protein n=1 Tax=Bradyrhizobium sp. AZCC 1693 TaxID=3117029 RepID=UPI002FF270DE
MLLKLARHDIAGGVVLFVVLTSVLHGLFTPWLAPKFPKFFRHGYEPLFFNAGLSFAEKIANCTSGTMKPVIAKSRVAKGRVPANAGGSCAGIAITSPALSVSHERR